MMKTTKMLIITILITVFLAGCGSTQNTPEMAKEQNNATIEESEVKDSLPPVKEEIPNNNNVQHQDVERKEESEDPVNSYFVNDKYFIKSVDKENEEKIVLLTFDDSPAGDSTQSILDILDKYNAKAIWFVNGYYADKNRDLLKDIHNRGHLIGNHTWWHENLKKIDEEKTREEIVSINDLVEEVIGVRPTYFRAPFGVYSDEAKKVIKEENMQYMNWTWGSLDWELKTSEEIEKNVIDHIHNGANILFHDKRITAEALDNILKQLVDKGYKFVLPTEVRIEN